MLSNQTIQDKNALATEAVILTLLELRIPSTPTVRLVSNTEDITWNGELWQCLEFTLSTIDQTAQGEVPQWTVKISNINRAIEQYIQAYDLYLKQHGIEGNEIECTIYAVNSLDLQNTTPILKHDAVLQKPSTDAQWGTFLLSAKNPYNKPFPPRRVYRNFCAWKFKSEECAYAGEGETCDKTLTTCRLLDNSTRFGGFVGTSAKGLIIA